MAKFTKGQSGNPKGRPKGIVDRRRRYLSLVEKHIPAVLEAVVSAAIGGDILACKILLDKVIPNIRPQTLVIDGLVLGEAPVDQADAVLEGLVNGSLAPEQAIAAMSVVMDHARIRELSEFEARLHALENRGNATMDK